MTQPADNDDQQDEALYADEDDLFEDDRGEEVHNDCRCGECCRSLLIEVELDDAEHEPRIKEVGSPIYEGPELTASGEKELIGYLLNRPDNGYACGFLDRSTNLCGIYETRPWVCRVFDCDGEGKDQLVQIDLTPGKPGGGKGASR
jgi:Fe-S-cluster containining protein